MSYSGFPFIIKQPEKRIMSSQEMAMENVGVETKQLIGSSKRKRKSSIIKHNVVQNEKNQLSDSSNSTKPVRTYLKKVKSERGRPGKDKSQNEVTEAVESIVPESHMKNVDDNGSASIDPVDVKVDGDRQDVLMKEENADEASEKLGMEEQGEECGGKPQQCQNCNFCAEHRQPNDDGKGDSSSKTYTCKICAVFGLKRVYNSIDNFKRHMKVVHEPKKDAKKFECTDCPEPVWFPTKSKYCYHLGAKHPGVIKFVCDVCTQTFKLKANYKNHLKTHNIVVQKKFSCGICGGAFVNRAGFEAHKKRFPGPHIKQSCVHCGISFSKEKHMQNHRCKILLLEEAAAARDNRNSEADKNVKPGIEEERPGGEEIGKIDSGNLIGNERKDAKEEGTPELEMETTEKFQQPVEGDPAANKRVLVHRIVPKKNEKVVYKQIPFQTQNAPQSVVVQEFREIDLEGGAFITAEPDQPIIVRDVNGQLVQGNQILQFDINDLQSGEESQVYLADLNFIGPLFLRGKSP